MNALLANRAKTPELSYAHSCRLHFRGSKLQLDPEILGVPAEQVIIPRDRANPEVIRVFLTTSRNYPELLGNDRPAHVLTGTIVTPALWREICKDRQLQAFVSYSIGFKPEANGYFCYSVPHEAARGQKFKNGETKYLDLKISESPAFTLSGQPFAVRRNWLHDAIF